MSEAPAQHLLAFSAPGAELRDFNAQVARCTHLYQFNISLQVQKVFS